MSKPVKQYYSHMFNVKSQNSQLNKLPNGTVEFYGEDGLLCKTTMDDLQLCYDPDVKEE